MVEVRRRLHREIAIVDRSSADAGTADRTIPLIEAGAAGPSALVEAEPGRLVDILAAGRRHYGGALAGAVVLRAGDRATRRWLAAAGNPYAAEIAAVAARIRSPGGFLLNLSYEWTCTTGVGADPAGRGSRLLRTLDWPMDSLGRNLAVARQEGDAGLYYAVTWPGFVGVATAMAPGRFAVALNQPPMPRITPSCRLDWVIVRRRWWRSRGLPPVHLLRRVCDSCRTYAEARDMVAHTPLCMPGFFTIAGLEPDEGCVVERLEDRAAIREAPTSAANHWRSVDLPGWPRGEDSVERCAMMERLRDGADDDFSWVTPPILNETTRVSVIANAARGTLLVRGWEADGPATEVFTL